MSESERSEILSEIKSRLESIHTVSKMNGTIKCGEDVRKVYRDLGVPISHQEEISIRSFALASN